MTGAEIGEAQSTMIYIFSSLHKYKRFKNPDHRLGFRKYEIKWSSTKDQKIR